MASKTPVEPAVYSVEQAAAYLGVARSTVHRLAASSAITYVRVSPRRRLFRRTDLDAYLNACVVQARKRPA